ncbi:hypothetical protein SAMN04488033_11686 [Salegentibacter agarivorans]|uniref:Uncharacterized protein n=1 Tax=Salegentibacter agarivorans TaxID=345907 RepID=A0A1I2MXX3_9FLAO|nr:hypothetical protein [Salegentibacter agarivorans]SFF95968.1 hypothetical protein SAMN04488033_11686 [Salegentibacter agarivorans]
MKKENIKYFYRIEITTWQEEQGSEEWLTYAREFKSADLLASQQQALAAWNRQMKAFEKGEIMPGFLGPKDSEDREWNWIEKAEAELLFIEMDGNNEYAFLLSGGLEEQNGTGRDAEKYALRTLGYKQNGMFG